MLERLRRIPVQRMVIDLDAASNGAAAGIIFSELAGAHSPELSLAASASTFWLLSHWLGVLVVNPGNFLRIGRHTRTS